LHELHHAIQQPASYLATLRRFGEMTGRRQQAERLTSYIETRLAAVSQGLAGGARRPRVYYAMGKPLFAINGPRFENSLAEAAGGHSVNRELDLCGRPGMTIPAQTLQKLNPEVILLSSFLANRPEDVRAECLRLGLEIDAVRNGRIHTPPLPTSDFGGPRWVLGLLCLANVLHPQRFSFDLEREAESFYREFYDIPFSPHQLNRSFGKPSSDWCWTT